MPGHHEPRRDWNQYLGKTILYVTAGCTRIQRAIVDTLSDNGILALIDGQWMRTKDVQVLDTLMPDDSDETSLHDAAVDLLRKDAVFAVGLSNDVPPERRFLLDQPGRFGRSPVAGALATLAMRDKITGRGPKPVAVVEDETDLCPACDGKCRTRTSGGADWSTCQVCGGTGRRAGHRRPSPWGAGRLVETEADRCTACDGYGRTEFDICADCNGTSQRACLGLSRLVDNADDRCATCDGYGRTWHTSGPEVTICEDCDGCGGNPGARLRWVEESRALPPKE